MNKKYLEALDRLYCSGNLQLDYVLSNKHKQDYELLKHAFQPLESIDNAEPSEALKCLERIDKEYLTIESKDFDNCFNTIKQALLKAQKLAKQYLKWDDLQFSYGAKTQKVRMGNTIYKIECVYYDNVKEVKLLSEDEKCYYLGFTGNYKDNVQLFNDLHLEKVEE